MALVTIGGLLFMLAFVCFLFTAAFLLQSVVLGLGAIMTLFTLSTMILLFLLPLGLFKSHRAFFAPKKGVLFYRALLTVLFLLTYFKALEMISLVDTMIIMQTMPLLVLGLAWLFTGEVITKPMLIAVGMGLLGSAILYTPFAGEIDLNMGLVLAFVSAGLLSIFLVLSRELATQTLLRPFVFYQALYTAIIFIPLVPFYFEIPGRACLGLCALAAISALLGYVFLYFAYQFANSSELSPFIFSQALFYALIGGYTLSDQNTLYFIGGGVVILAGMVFVVYKQRVKSAAN